MSGYPVRVAAVGVGRWSDVLAAGIQRTPEVTVVSCYLRSGEKREAFAGKMVASPREP